MQAKASRALDVNHKWLMPLPQQVGSNQRQGHKQHLSQALRAETNTFGARPLAELAQHKRDRDRALDKESDVAENR